jgi:protein tyrosine/serine phosphatase
MPARKGYETLTKMGIRTVINLRTTESERKMVEGAGMRSVEIPLNMFDNGDREKVDRIVALMADPANQPVFVHCKLGKDRTGIVVAAFRMKVEGWPLAQAEAEMDSFGFNDAWIHLRRFLHRYAAGLDPRKQRTVLPEER